MTIVIIVIIVIIVMVAIVIIVIVVDGVPNNHHHFDNCLTCTDKWVADRGCGRPTSGEDTGYRIQDTGYRMCGDDDEEADKMGGDG